VPDGKKADEIYHVIAESLRASGKAGIGQTLRGPEELCAVMALEQGLLLETLRYDIELQEMPAFFEKSSSKAKGDYLNLARKLIEEKTGLPSFERYHDHYHEALEDLIEAKRHHRAARVKAPAVKPEKVVNFMNALKRSLKSGKRTPAKSAAANKRDFTKTAEPRGDAPRASGVQLKYLIQKHAARRLHYDFRLELDGTLKSWAVTKGPSLDPADKRLAVHVEDHPLEYGSFEGTIPQGQYGGGTVMLWDEGTWEPVGHAAQAYKKGRLTFILYGKRLKGEWHLVRMGGRAKDGKRDNWLLIKSHDKYAREGDGDRALERYQKSAVSDRSMEAIAKGNKQWVAKAGNAAKPAAASRAKKTKKAAPKKKPATSDKAPPAFIAPELATLVSDPPSGDGWVHEIKFDGYRALCRIAGGKTKLLTRNNNDWTDKFKFIAEQMGDLDIDNAILDGEITTIDETGAMSFGALQQALSNRAQDKLHYYLFDALYLNGEDLRRKPLLERKQALRDVIPSGHTSLHYSDHFVEPGKDVLQHACHIAQMRRTTQAATMPGSNRNAPMSRNLSSAATPGSPSIPTGSRPCSSAFMRKSS
jgi:DNA ligase D-like protein (predicted 3'-phosphoesterase)